jgi:signal transduction histidine kinase
VVRHAGAHKVWVDLGVTDDDLELVVSDDGRGVQDEAPTRGGGNGLPNLRSRAGRLGGSMVMAPRIGGGTVLRWRAPLER